MKKVFLLLILLTAFSSISFAQAARQLSFGIIGINYEMPLSPAITFGIGAGSNLNLDYLSAGVLANYYFDSLIDLPSDWDVYGGANVGYAFGQDDKESDLDFGLQVGGRWFWSPKWGVYLQAGGSKVSGGSAGIGLTMKL